MSWGIISGPLSQTNYSSITNPPVMPLDDLLIPIIISPVPGFALDYFKRRSPR